MPIAGATRYECLLFDEEGEEWVVDSRLRFETLTRPVWPGIPTAEVSLVLADLGADPLRMEDGLTRIAYGRRLLVKEAGDAGKCLFVGTITGKVLVWKAKDESCRYVAKHSGLALQERFILGAHGRTYSDFSENGPIAGQQTHFEGWSPIVNPGGRGNMSLVGYEEGGVEKCRLYSPEDSALSEPWTTKEFLKQLFFWAQAEGLVEGITFPGLPGEGILDDQPKDLDPEGKSWWEAIGITLKRVGWRCRQDTGGTGTNPTAFVAMWKIGSGTHRTVQLGAAGGAVEVADNAEQGTLDFDCSGTVTLPKVWGGPLQLEGCWPLVAGWKVADLDTEARPAKGDDPEEAPDLWNETYYQRYCADPRATDFAKYQDVGRKWVLNESGDYSVAAYGNPPVFDFGAAYGNGQGETAAWARRKRRFLECLSWDGLKNRASIKAEISFDAKGHWQPLPHSEILADECAIRITVKDLATLKPDPDLGSDFENYWEALCEGGGYLKVRTTASVADDSAVQPTPALAVPAWSPLQRAVELPFDRRTHYGRRVRLSAGAYASQWCTDCSSADTTDDTAALSAEASAIQAANAAASIRGPIVLRDTTFAFDPGDVVTEIAGRGISLRQDGAGGEEIYAEVVQVSQIVGDGIYTTEVLLEDARVALVR